MKGDNLSEASGYLATYNASYETWEEPVGDEREEIIASEHFHVEVSDTGVALLHQLVHATETVWIN